MAHQILLIESDSTLRDFWVQVFREEGFQVLTACDEAQALHYVRTGNPSLIFMGSNMEGEQGLSLMGKLKSERNDLLVVAPLNALSLREELLSAQTRVGGHPRVHVERLTLAVKKALQPGEWEATPFGNLSITQMEREMIEQALRRAGGNQTQAARLLGISRFALRNRLKKYRLSPEQTVLDASVRERAEGAIR
jgi:DNA-binding NtrC family response regulator